MVAGVGQREGVIWEDLSMDEFIMGEENFLQHYFKNSQKLYKETSFFQLKVRSNIKIMNTDY